MSIDDAIRRLHVAIYDDFGTSGVEYQMTIIKALEELLDNLKLSVQ